MNHRRLVGIDLGIATAHTVRVLDGEGTAVAKRKAWPTAESLTAVETAALAGCPAGTRLEVVIEPTGPAWLPIAVFFSARGHQVFRVSSQKAADLRRFLSRHAKSNGIDADTLARLPLFDPAGLRPLELPSAERAALDRRVRATDRLTREAAEHKRRIKDLARQLLPMSPLSGDHGAADLAVLERYADPHALTRLGPARLTALIVKASRNHQGAGRARRVARCRPGIAGALRWPPRRRLRRRGRRGRHRGPPAARHPGRARRPRRPPRGPLPPGRPRPTGPVAARASRRRWSRTGRVHGQPGRFGHGKQFRSYTGLAPKPPRPGKPTARPAHVQSRILAAAHHDGARRRHRPQARPPARPHLLPADDRTRQRPPRRRLRRRRRPRRAGLDRHAPRHPYIICDTDGHPVTPQQAKTIIAERWTVPPEVRARRRSKKTGKAPQKVPEGHSTRGDLPHRTTSPRHGQPVKLPS